MAVVDQATRPATARRPYAGNSINGWMPDRELAWLYERATEMRSVVEVGSWQGKSTHALLTGCPGLVWAVDTWTWQPGWWAIRHRGGDPFRAFLESVGDFRNLRIVRADSLVASVVIPDVDMVFIDGSHRYTDLCLDLEAWGPKATRLLCGHDYDWKHPSVKRAVREVVGPVETVGSIWFQWR